MTRQGFPFPLSHCGSIDLCIKCFIFSSKRTASQKSCILSPLCRSQCDCFLMQLLLGSVYQLCLLSFGLSLSFVPLPFPPFFPFPSFSPPPPPSPMSAPQASSFSTPTRPSARTSVQPPPYSPPPRYETHPPQPAIFVTYLYTSLCPDMGTH